MAEMPEPQDDPRVLALAPGFRMQWEPAQDAHVLLYPEGMVKLNASAAEVIGCCDGERSLGEVVRTLEQRFPGADLAGDVVELVEQALARGWLRVVT